jgi:cell filamentation protein, protein adenylyltransferase
MEMSSSKWLIAAQDVIFENSTFKICLLIKRSGTLKHVATWITRLLQDRWLLKELGTASGRRGALYMFEPLMEIVRA